MLTQTRRSPSERQIARHRLKLSQTISALEKARTGAKWNAPALTVACMISAMLAIAGYKIGSIELLAVDVPSFIVLCYFLAAALHTDPKERCRGLETERDTLLDLIDKGWLVETRVTSSRYFSVLPVDDEGILYYFDLGDQGTLIIDENSIHPFWTPNTDFTISYLETPKGRRFDESVRSLGQRLEPLVEIPPSKLMESDYEHMKVIPGSFDERLLARRKAAGV